MALISNHDSCKSGLFCFLLWFLLFIFLSHRKIPSSYMGISVQKMVEISIEAFANTGTSLCTARLCMCEWLSLHTLHLQLPTQNCHFVKKMWTPLSTEGIPLFLDALPRLKNTPLPGERKGSREDLPFKPAVYPWNSKTSLHWIRGYPALSAPREKTHFYIAFTYLQFYFANSYSETTHQHGETLNAAFSVCREHMRDVFSVMEQSSPCTAVSLWHQSCGQEQWEDVWPRTSPPWLLNTLPLLSHYNGSSMDISCGLRCLQGPRLRQKKKKNPTLLLFKIYTVKRDGFALVLCKLYLRPVIQFVFEVIS